jgi:hypothetical protein
MTEFLLGNILTNEESNIDKLTPMPDLEKDMRRRNLLRKIYSPQETLLRHCSIQMIYRF